MEVDLPNHITKALSAVQLRYAEDIIVLSGPEIQRRTGLSKGDADMALLLSCSRVYPLSHRTAAVALHSPDSPWQRYQPVQDLSICYKSSGKRSAVLAEAEGSQPTKQRKLFHWDRDSRPSGIHAHVTKRTRLTLGCAVLDSYFGGGVLVPGVTEITGDSSSGKTQWALQLCLTCQLPLSSGGLDAGAKHPVLTHHAIILILPPPGALYISTEAAFPTKRLADISTHASARYDAAPDTDWGAQVYVESVRDLPALLATLRTRVPALIRSRQVKLIVIDSVTSVFRGNSGRDRCVRLPVGLLGLTPLLPFSPATTYSWCSGGSGRAIKRTDGIFQLGLALNTLADQMGVAVVCINQVTAAISDGDTFSASNPFDDANRSKPALGLLWSHMIRQRIVLSRRDRGTRSYLPLLPRYDIQLADSTRTQTRVHIPTPTPTHPHARSIELHRTPSGSAETSADDSQYTGGIVGCPLSPTLSVSAPVSSQADAEVCPPDSRVNIRDAQVVLAPHLAMGRAEFVISHEGIHGYVCTPDQT
ncbi:hypothetical protein SARC_03815 [Sphaeroforma arctica JP610]|uniref:RecA family profile 1 domain-containing protein n=1 Tax=Sphaeroforma arctica JP610 TaxID=667725 RepID=A0A0L0G551_9EUKA|nr:hypothetical protein SARC_03815 [Sphaeroforma arctica JP610]KNC83951.1 hypothetical protein SARC_03815 [Sphaeroforma arctica JP610]|eukprot:XP_014157853.1 hypothetical protein SARC_03815 [Sphaeroforma arctica JP610]